MPDNGNGRTEVDLDHAAHSGLLEILQLGEQRTMDRCREVLAEYHPQDYHGCHEDHSLTVRKEYWHTTCATRVQNL